MRPGWNRRNSRDVNGRQECSAYKPRSLDLPVFGSNVEPFAHFEGNSWNLAASGTSSSAWSWCPTLYNWAFNWSTTPRPRAIRKVHRSSCPSTSSMRCSSRWRCASI